MSLANKAIRGAVWTISSGIGSRALGLVGTLVITRFMSPHAYGEVSVASVLVLTAQQLSTLGIGQYVIAVPNAQRDISFHATLYHLVSGVIALALLWAFGSLLGPMMDAPGAGQFLPGLILAAAFDRVLYVPERLLVRDMRFAALSLARSAGDIAYTALSVGLAAAGYGAMAIVWGNLARSVVRTGIVVLYADVREWLWPCRLSWQRTRELFAYGLPLAVAAFGTFASRRWDNLLVSRYFGPATAGAYNLAYNLADVPAIQVGEQVGDVLFPSFARLAPERRVDALLRALTLLSLVVFPLALGLGAVAHTLVRVLFDERWQAVAPMLVLLSALSITRPVGWTNASYLKAKQRPRIVMWIELLTLVALLVAVASFGRFSPLWTCVAVGLAFGAQVVAGFWVISREDQLPMSRLFATIATPLLASTSMAAVVVGARFVLGTSNWPALLALAFEMVLGAATYVALAFTIARSPSLELIDRVRGAFRKRAEA